MNCNDSDRLIDAYLDGQLSGSLRLEFDAHRVRCRRCQQTLATMEACLHLIATDQRGPALGDDFTARVMQRVAPEQPVRRLRLSPLMISVGALTAQAAAVALFFSIFPRGGSVIEPAGEGALDRVLSPALFDERVARIEREDALRAEFKRVLGEVVSQTDRPVSRRALDLALYLNDFELSERIAASLRGASDHPVSTFAASLFPGLLTEPPADASEASAPRETPHDEVRHEL